MAHPSIVSVFVGPPALWPQEETAARRAFSLRRVFTQLLFQRKLLSQVSTESGTLQDSLSSLRSDLETLRSINSLEACKRIPTKQTVRDLLYNPGTTFELSLLLCSTVENPVCKGKYFHFDVCLHSRSPGLTASDELLVRASVYSADTMPRQLTENMLGHPLLTGTMEKRMKFEPNMRLHKARFRVQLNEVTSRFCNGWVFLVVSAQEDNEFLVRTGYNVEPLIVEHLVSKAKQKTCEQWKAKAKVRDIQPDAYRLV